jgi:4-hydroxybenzoate polyprenyltransferase/phosphoserine phosphatase
LLSSTIIFRRLLFVDMDGTLIHSDTLWEQIIKVIRNPFLLPGLIFSVFKGKLAFKQFCLTHAGSLDPSILPYNQDVLESIKQAKANGSTIILCTAALYDIALSVSSYLNCFDDILSSSVSINLSSFVKRDVILQYTDSEQFDYIGNSHTDIPVWTLSGRAIIAKPEYGLVSKVEKSGITVHVVSKNPSFSNYVSIITKQIRVYQWIKNALIFIPFLLAHIINYDVIIQSLCAFLCISLSASAVYIYNDLMDLDSDRQHHRKKNRPLASGAFSIPHSLMFIPILIFSAYLLSVTYLSLQFTLLLSVYLLLTTFYSISFKKIAIVDVILLAALYTLRLIAGGIANNVVLSPWLLGFGMFVFLSLAFVKRYTEVLLHADEHAKQIAGRGYTSSDGSILLSAGISSAMISILVLALYMNSTEVSKLYHNPLILWILCPIFMIWLLRVWLIAHRGNMHDDPIIFMAKDSFSYIMFSLILAVVLLAAL